MTIETDRTTDDSPDNTEWRTPRDDLELAALKILDAARAVKIRSEQADSWPCLSEGELDKLYERVENLRAALWYEVGENGWTEVVVAHLTELVATEVIERVEQLLERSRANDGRGRPILFPSKMLSLARALGLLQALAAGEIREEIAGR